ncbi:MULTISPECIES: LysM peptidoglycan-binding domain-containing protein [Clostridium]|uniref:LysM peptidoglycan-binding domain-containing protein n=1 Tax=Clostridium TaxID=1485 RepID=UPI000773D7EE|nr:LysM peptidoglycan-binding domain-containing protein [Clostridium sporogenes]STC80476.1 Peptidoglycan-binding lysin domain [Clostridium botulinum]MCW6087259.1 LysM peptidoglycan-binding domain-containing protein [Clostridium sporogenes]MDS1007154.1 LysM peptidoglycan-binding domain-containing protein [Clostridium sporogenes]NFD95725.1 LysM peptidoglycan-binding domain-containing protein [Clostridium sporogenes]NFE47355.1 LysM peptidoglycan-binding domain-containing protein [Clostridium spor
MKSKKLITTVLITIFLLAGSSMAKANTINYTVQSGDSLWKISKKFNTTVSNITTLNKLNVNNPIYVGQVLTISNTGTTTSTTASNTIKHTVVSGDTLWKLSIQYKTTVDKIKQLNNLTRDTIFIGQVLVISSNSYNNTTISSKVQTTNHKVAVGENLWTVAQKYNTSMDAIMKSNMLASNILMPGQILTVPVNSTAIVSPVGITMMRTKTNNIYGDLYNWENGRRIFTVGQTATIKDLNTGITFKAKYYGGANHADIVALTKEDTANLKKIFPSWSWNYKRPMVLCFSQGGKYYQLAVSVTGMPHGDTNVYDNGLAGHLDMYFYNSVGHSNPAIDQTHQSNVLKANGQ